MTFTEKLLQDLEGLILAFNRRGERIRELEDGACRFNCRTKKDWESLVEAAYMAGYDDGMEPDALYINRLLHFREWKASVESE